MLRKAIEINPNSDSAHTNLGSILKDLKKFNEAELYHRKAINIVWHINGFNGLKNGFHLNTITKIYIGISGTSDTNYSTFYDFILGMIKVLVER